MSRDTIIGYTPKARGGLRPLFLREEHRGVHMSLFGRSGSGKTYLMEHLIREDIRRGRGVCVLDPNGDLYQRLVAFCHRYGFTRKLILINPRDERWAVGLNYLQHGAVGKAATHAQTVARGINKVYGDEDPDLRPQLTRWLENTLTALVAAGLTLEDAQLFLTDTLVRNRILSQIGDPYLASEWQMFAQATDRNRDDWLAPVLNRLARFYKSEVTRRIVGQQASTIDFRSAIDSGATILVNLAAGEQFSRQEAKLIGVMLIDKLTEAARSRTDIPESRRRRFYLYLDEFQNYLCEDIALGLKELRKYGLSFVLATQELAPIREEEFRIYSALQANTDIKVVFAVQPDDVELLTNQLFPEYLARDVTKRELTRTLFRPVLGRAQSYTFSGSSGYSRSESSSSSRGRTEFSGYASGDSTSRAQRVGAVPVVDEAGNVRSGALGDTAMESEGSYEMYSGGEATTEGETHGSSSGYNRSHSWSVSDSPFYYMEEDQETASIEDYTPEEKRLHIMAKLVNLPKRHAVIKVQDRRGDAMDIVTPELPVKQEIVPQYLARTIERVHERVALPAVEVDSLIAARRSGLLRLTAATPDDIDTFSYPAKHVRRRNRT